MPTQAEEWGDLLSNAQALARRRPMLVIGGAVAAGFFAARYLKSKPAPAKDWRNLAMTPPTPNTYGNTVPAAADRSADGRIGVELGLGTPGVRGSGFGVRGSGFGVRGSGFRVLLRLLRGLVRGRSARCAGRPRGTR